MTAASAVRRADTPEQCASWEKVARHCDDRHSRNDLTKVLLMSYSYGMTTTKPKVQWDGEIQNTCTCTKYDPIKDEFTDEPSDYCDGSCWDDTLHLFHCEIKQWWDANPTYNWRVDGLPLWNRSVSGEFTAKNIPDFIRGITVKAEWLLRYKLENDVLHCHLSHHDVPTGRSYTVHYGTDDGDE